MADFKASSFIEKINTIQSKLDSTHKQIAALTKNINAAEDKKQLKLMDQRSKLESSIVALQRQRANLLADIRTKSTVEINSELSRAFAIKKGADQKAESINSNLEQAKKKFIKPEGWQQYLDYQNALATKKKWEKSSSAVAKSQAAKADKEATSLAKAKEFNISKIEKEANKNGYAEIQKLEKELVAQQKIQANANSDVSMVQGVMKMVGMETTQKPKAPSLAEQLAWAKKDVLEAQQAFDNAAPQDKAQALSDLQEARAEWEELNEQMEDLAPPPPPPPSPSDVEGLTNLIQNLEKERIQLQELDAAQNRIVNPTPQDLEQSIFIKEQLTANSEGLIAAHSEYEKVNPTVKPKAEYVQEQPHQNQFQGEYSGSIKDLADKLNADSSSFSDRNLNGERARIFTKPTVGPQAFALKLNEIPFDIKPPLYSNKVEAMREIITKLAMDLEQNEEWKPFWTEAKKIYCLSDQEVAQYQKEVVQGYCFKTISQTTFSDKQYEDLFAKQALQTIVGKLNLDSSDISNFNTKIAAQQKAALAKIESDIGKSVADQKIQNYDRGLWQALKDTGRNLMAGNWRNATAKPLRTLDEIAEIGGLVVYPNGRREFPHVAQRKAIHVALHDEVPNQIEKLGLSTQLLYEEIPTDEEMLLKEKEHQEKIAKLNGVISPLLTEVGKHLEMLEGTTSKKRIETITPVLNQTIMNVLAKAMEGERHVLGDMPPNPQWFKDNRQLLDKWLTSEHITPETKAKINEGIKWGDPLKYKDAVLSDPTVPTVEPQPSAKSGSENTPMGVTMLFDKKKSIEAPKQEKTTMLGIEAPKQEKTPILAIEEPKRPKSK